MKVGAAGDAGKIEDSVRANGHRDGIGKTRGQLKRFKARKCDMDPVRASSCRPAATVNAPHQQAGHTKALDPTLEIGQGKIPCRRGVHTRLP